MPSTHILAVTGGHADLYEVKRVGGALDGVLPPITGSAPEPLPPSMSVPDLSVARPSPCHIGWRAAARHFPCITESPPHPAVSSPPITGSAPEPFPSPVSVPDLSVARLPAPTFGMRNASIARRLGGKSRSSTGISGGNPGGRPGFRAETPVVDLDFGPKARRLPAPPRRTFATK